MPNDNVLTPEQIGNAWRASGAVSTTPPDWALNFARAIEREVLAAHLGQPEPRAEVTGEVIPWGRVLELGDKHGMQWAGKTGWRFESDDPLYAFANDVARYAIAALNRSKA